MLQLMCNDRSAEQVIKILFDNSRTSRPAALICHTLKSVYLEQLQAPKELKLTQDCYQLDR